jgi:hypothetical protein
MIEEEEEEEEEEMYQSFWGMEAADFFAKFIHKKRSAQPYIPEKFTESN